MQCTRAVCKAYILLADPPLPANGAVAPSGFVHVTSVPFVALSDQYAFPCVGTAFGQKTIHPYAFAVKSVWLDKSNVQDGASGKVIPSMVGFVSAHAPAHTHNSSVNKVKIFFFISFVN